VDAVRSPLAALVALLAAGCLLDGEPKQRSTTTPPALDDGWPIATPAEVGLDPAVLAAIHDELLQGDRHLGALGLLVIKDGALVFETYLRSQDDRAALHPVRSITKTVTALSYGAARQRGLAPPPDATLCSTLGGACDGLDPAIRQVRLEHLLTMRSGIDFDNGDYMREMWLDPPADPLRHILAKPLHAMPGEVFRYSNADAQLLSYGLSRWTGAPMRALTEEVLLGPLGIDRYHWEDTPDGQTPAPHGLYLSPRDLARLGQCLLDRGRWRGEAVIDERFVAAATAPRVVSDEPWAEGLLDYGYHLWIIPGSHREPSPSAQGRVPGSHREPSPSAQGGAPGGRGYLAFGRGGQYVLVVPDRRLVVVEISLAFHDLHGSRPAEFLELTAPLWR
jgi:CubicO group peptidase (beta-lactamase class C family)